MLNRIGGLRCVDRKFLGNVRSNENTSLFRYISIRKTLKSMSLLLKYSQAGDFKKLNAYLKKKKVLSFEEEDGGGEEMKRLESEEEKEGININEIDSDGDSSLILAACIGSLECLQLLLKYGADPNLRNKVFLFLSLIFCWLVDCLTLIE